MHIHIDINKNFNDDNASLIVWCSFSRAPLLTPWQKQIQMFFFFNFDHLAMLEWIHNPTMSPIPRALAAAAAKCPEASGVTASHHATAVTIRANSNTTPVLSA
jgi:hypothetical protein